MRVMVVGAGVIGSVYAARLAEVGHDVALVARGRRLDALRADGLRVRSGGRTLAPDVSVVSDVEHPSGAELMLVSVRAPQLGPVLTDLERAAAPTVGLLQHLGPHAGEVSARLGSERTVLAFPGVGGLILDDGIVEYVEVAAQPTTVDRRAPRAEALRDVLASTRMRTALEPDMPAWLATHEVFVACLGAGILSRGGDPAALSADAPMLRRVVAAIREGLVAQRGQGVAVTPAPLRTLFLRLLRRFAAAYWRRALRGPVGTIALAPHTRASRNDEFPLLCDAVLSRLHGERTASLDALLAPYRSASG